MANQIKQCRTCQFFQNRNGNGECKRHAPTMKLPQSHPEQGIWPWVNGGDWCGDYLYAPPEYSP